MCALTFWPPSLSLWMGVPREEELIHLVGTKILPQIYPLCSTSSEQ